MVGPATCGVWSSVRSYLAGATCSLPGGPVHMMLDGGSRADPDENPTLNYLPMPVMVTFFCLIPFLKALAWRSSTPLWALMGGNPGSVDRMTATLFCHSPWHY